MANQKVLSYKIEPEQDDHVFIHIEPKWDAASVSLDLHDTHGRRSLSIRVNGMTVASILIDPDITGSGEPQRYCPICGEEINLLSSKSHKCRELRP